MKNPLPPLPRENLFTERSGLPSIMRKSLPADAWKHIEPRLQELGRVSAQKAIALADIVDKETPKHVPFDPLGNRIDEIRHNPAYRELERLSYGAGIVNMKYDEKMFARFPSSLNQMSFAMTMVFGGAESGMLCPLCMTDGVARVLKVHGTEDQKKRIIPRLASTDMSTLWRGSMFLTEKQGGSDVGANTCRAVKEGDTWKLYGDKWFCSNVDAEVALVLARTDDAPNGTYGLGLYLVETNLPGGGKNNFVIHRIKDKLGTRSMATGEITFNGTAAELLGGAGKGWKMMAEMVNLSRAYNATVAVGGLSRALEEATYFAEHRMAFGMRLADHRMHLETLADLWAEYLGCLALVVSCAHELDAVDAGDQNAWSRVRLLTPIAKRHTGRFAVDGVSMCLELIGGQAYVEDTSMPRLFRDAQVLPIWEGTSHMQLWDVLRSIVKEKSLGLVEYLSQDLSDASVKRSLEETAKVMTDHLDLASYGSAARHIVDAFGTAVMRALLVRWGDPRALLASRRMAEKRALEPWKAAAACSDDELRQLCGL